MTFAWRTDAYGAVGTDMYVLITDTSGQTLAEWVYGESLEEFAHRIVLGAQGDYFKVNELGNIKWSQTFDEGSRKGYSLLQLTNGRLLIAGARSSEGDPLQSLLMLLKANGREVWSQHLW